ncbi:DUF3201 domain-containing protein [Deltaproteobacteria bacterium OttesenSCG-928-K17]|nr:DUF3201 domain-containing protein [Deltaproteobacteria bacterium OttesenSCG-928-K17]
MPNNTIEELLKDAQKKYHLSKKELYRLSDLLDYHPDVYPDWESMVGLTPSQIALQVAEEFCVKFPYPVFISRPRGEIMITPELFVKLLGPHKSWRELEDGLRKMARYFDYGEAFDFCERKVFVTYATLRRNDFYGLRGDNRGSGKSDRRYTAEKRTIEVELDGVKQKITFPEFQNVQCRHCWRYVSVDPKKVTRKAPLCALHSIHPIDHPSDSLSGTPEYRARQRLVPAYWQQRLKLAIQITPRYVKQKEAGRDVNFLRELATSSKSLFPALSSYMRSLALPLESDEDLIRAFNYMDGIKLSSEDEKRFSDMIDFFLSIKSGVPVPLTLLDCVSAEAWLRVGQRGKRK